MTAADLTGLELLLLVAHSRPQCDRVGGQRHDRGRASHQRFSAAQSPGGKRRRNADRRRHIGCRHRIAYGAILDVPIGSDASTIDAAFYIPTIDPMSRVRRSTAIVDPGDIVASAELFASHYVNVPNTNDCGWIGDDVAAAAGATMPYQNWSTDPDENVDGGFWRIAYRGSDETNPVSDWSTVVQPGDIVRMGWIGGGQHTTTVLAKNADGTLSVYDNMDIVAGQSSSVIGIHDADYWTDTIPASITIYRLDPDHQFLISGTDTGEYLQGSVYDNLFQPVGGNATIVDGPGQDEIQGAAADLGGAQSRRGCVAIRLTSPISHRRGQRKITTQRVAC